MFEQGVVVEITNLHTSAATWIYTHVTTSTATLTLSEVQVFLSSGVAVLLLVIVAGAAVAVVVFMRRKAPAPERRKETSEKPRVTEEMPAKPSGQMKEALKFCRHCGAKIPTDSTFCMECGKKL